MSLEKFCHRTVVSVSPTDNIQEACQLLRTKNIGCLLAEEDGKLCGILTDRDIALRVVGEGKDPKWTRVREVMTPNPVRIAVDKSLHELTSMMHAHHIRRVPIVDEEGKAIGIVTFDDLLALLGDELSDMGQTVREAFLAKPVMTGPEGYDWWASF